MSEELKSNINESENIIQEKTAETSARQQEEVISDARFKEALDVLYDEGGFDLIGTTVDGAENMQPGALRDVFLSDDEMKGEREAL